MNLKKISPRFVLLVLIILIAAILRLVIHAPNFTPIAAMALFGGAYFQKKWLAFIVPLGAMFISDIFIGFHDTIFAVYFAFAISVGIGIYLSKNIRISSVLIGALSSSVLFFLITNFAVWMTGMVGYPMNFAGLIECYIAGIPFFRTEVLGTLVYSSIFFGGFYIVTKRYPVFAKV